MLGGEYQIRTCGKHYPLVWYTVYTNICYSPPGFHVCIVPHFLEKKELFGAGYPLVWYTGIPNQ